MYRNSWPVCKDSSPFKSITSPQLCHCQPTLSLVESQCFGHWDGYANCKRLGNVHRDNPIVPAHILTFYLHEWMRNSWPLRSKLWGSFLPPVWTVTVPYMRRSTSPSSEASWPFIMQNSKVINEVWERRETPEVMKGDPCLLKKKMSFLNPLLSE